jgi:ATP-binding cassette, subfamily B, bacterial
VYAPRQGEASSGEKPALQGVSVMLDAGSHVAVVGSTGSGKTTLARLLCRLVDPSSGGVFLAGHDLRLVADDALRSVVALVPQEPFLFDTTVGENVLIGAPGASPDMVSAAFAALGLDDWLAGLPDGVDTRVGYRGEQLSAGERQLVALVRSWIAGPGCLILDEATSSVDSATDAAISRAFERLESGRTSVVIAHRLSTAARADRILVFEDGQLVQDGGHDALLKTEGAYARLWNDWIQANATS